jgi:hypothetical protein
LIAATWLLSATISQADNERPWSRYENDFFLAYSNADPSKAGKTLAALEQFRAAAFQIPSFVVPAGRPRTLVVLPATREEFLKFADYESVAAFATMLASQPAIVLPAIDPDPDIHAIIGHEFAHTLLFNDYFSYPSWYAEGFAEIASSIVVDRKTNKFVVGVRDDLRKKSASPALNWDDLIDETFNAHTLGDLNLTASAYAQDWLLVHYLTMNESRDFTSELNRYFANVNNGLSGQVAFTNAFGKSVADIGSDDLGKYVNKLSNQAFSFDPSLMDLDFQVSHGVEAEIRPTLEYMKDNADIRHGRNAPEHPREFLAGQWDWLRLDNRCPDPMTFRIRDDSNVLVLESFYSDVETDPVPALFAIEDGDGGAMILTNITANEYPQVKVASDYRAVMKSENVMCFDAQPAARDCLRVLQRCD